MLDQTLKKKCMELNFKEIELQNASIGLKNVTIGLKNATIGLLEYGLITLINFFLHGTRFQETRVPCNFFF